MESFENNHHHSEMVMLHNHLEQADIDSNDTEAVHAAAKELLGDGHPESDVEAIVEAFFAEQQRIAAAEAEADRRAS